MSKSRFYGVSDDSFGVEPTGRSGDGFVFEIDDAGGLCIRGGGEVHVTADQAVKMGMKLMLLSENAREVPVT